MPTKSKFVIGIAAAACVSLGAGVAAAATLGANADPASEQRTERQYTDAHRKEAAISQARAERLARKARPGSVVESHLQSEGNGLQWEVKVQDRNHAWEVQVDPATGDITSNQGAE